jgi:hypothetical protein
MVQRNQISIKKMATAKAMTIFPWQLAPALFSQTISSDYAIKFGFPAINRALSAELLPVQFPHYPS